MNIWGHKKQMIKIRKRKEILMKNPRRHEYEIRRLNSALHRRKKIIEDLRKLKPKKK